VGQITGTSGDDILEGTTGDDVIDGLGGADSIRGDDGVDDIDGGAGDDGIQGGDGDDVIDGGAHNDSISGDSGDDEIDGGTGVDTLRFGFLVDGVMVDLDEGTSSGDGDDTLAGIENVDGTRGDDRLTGDGNDNRLHGADGADILRGGGGNDDLNGDYGDPDGLAVDELDGGDGDDEVTLGLNDSGDGGTGFDTLYIDLSNRPGGTVIDLSAVWGGGIGSNGSGTVEGFERLGYISGSVGADEIIVGTSGEVEEGIAAPHVLGHSGNDELTGGDDRDSLHGGDDDDKLYGLGGDDGLTGGDGVDRIEGGAGDDVLVGGLGADVLIGGTGGDTYSYQGDGAFPSQDQIVEAAADDGIDMLFIHAGIAVADSAFTGVRNVERVALNTLTDVPGFEAVLGAQFQATGIRTVIASADIDASQVTAGLSFIVTRPNIRPLTVTAGSGDDSFSFSEHSLPPFVEDYVLAGGAGFDSVHFDQGGNPFEGSNGGELLLSQFEAFVLAGGTDAVAVAGAADQAGRNKVYTLTLADSTMTAGTQFTVDASALRADRAVWLGSDGELGGTGENSDILRSDELHLDSSQLTGGRSVKALGGAGADRITGSAANDVILAGGGDDQVRGGVGVDSIDGGEGSDLLEGGLGSDTYFVDDSADQVVEANVAGTDTVRSSASFTLGSYVENLVLTGASGIDGTGNGLNNLLTGNGAANALSGGSGHDRLDGGAGADTLTGGTGHDVYVVDNAGDQVIEGGSGGNDTVESSIDYTLPTHVERLVLTGTAGRDGRGNSGDNNLAGNSGGNLLNGGSGDDSIAGGGGNDLIYGSLGDDVLNGGAGLDRFLFNTAPGAGNVDNIVDFSIADDVINLASYVFTKAGANGILAAGAFHQGTAAADAGDRVVYDQASGSLFYDPDGSGAAAQVLFATVAAGTALTNADFVIYG